MLDLPLTLTDITHKPARLLTITRQDGTIIRIAEAQSDITVDGDTWSPLGGFSMSAVKHSVGTEAASVQIEAAMTVGGLIDTYAVVDGKYDEADVQVDVVNRASPTSVGLLFSGSIGPISFAALHDSVSFDCRGHSKTVEWPFVQTFGPMCRTDLGSILCRVPLRPDVIARNTIFTFKANANGFNNVFGRVSSGASTPDGYENVYFECTQAGTTGSSAPAYNFTVGATTNDGTAIFTCRNAWTRHARIASVVNQFNVILDRDPDPRAISGWYNQGVMRMHDGYSAGRGFQVGAWTASTRMVTFYKPIIAAGNSTLIAADDWLEIWRGCDFTINTCATVFANSEQFRGEPYFAGAAAAAQQNPF